MRPGKLIRYVVSSPLLRQASVYTISNLAAKAIPFLLLPVLTRYLTPADYGVVAMFMLVASLVEPFVGLGLTGAISVKYYDKNTDLGTFISTGCALVVWAAVPIGVLLVVLRGPLSELTAVPAAWLGLVIALVVVRVFAGLVPALWQVQERAIGYGVFQNLQSAAILGGSLLFVIVLGRHWQGRIEAELLAVAVAASVALLVLRRAGLLRWRFDRAYARQLLRFGLPLIPHTIGGVLIVQTDRMFVTHYVGVDETGLFTVGYQLALIVELAASSFNNAYVPWLFRKLTGGGDEIKQRLVRYTYLQFGGLVVFATVVGLVMPVVAGYLLGDQFASAARYVRWLALAFAFMGMYYMVASYIFYAERTSWLAMVTLTSGLANIPLNYILIRANGAIGAAQATACAMALTFVLTWIVSARVYPMPWGHPFRRRRAEST